MPHEIVDVQKSQFAIANDNTEQTIYARTILAGEITGITLFRLLLGGTISSRALLPGTITLKHKCAGTEVALLSETMLVGMASAPFLINLDCWLIPGAINVVGVGGIFAQNASDVFSPAGSRIASNAGTINLGVDNVLSATFQFNTADPGNIFIRNLCSMLLLTS